MVEIIAGLADALAPEIATVRIPEPVRYLVRCLGLNTNSSGEPFAEIVKADGPYPSIQLIVSAWTCVSSIMIPIGPLRPSRIAFA
jgi:hypothetical protein